MQQISLPEIDSSSFSHNLFECTTIDKLTDHHKTKEPKMLKMGAICICLEGCGEININEKRHNIKQGDMITLLPNTIVSNASSNDDFVAYVVGINTKVLTHIKMGDVVKSFVDINNNPVLHITDQQAQCIIEICEMLKRKRAQQDHPFGQEICNSLLAVLCYEIHSFYRQHIATTPTQHSRKGQLLQEFLALVNDHAIEHRDLKFYADKLFITHKYLSSVVKKASGQSPSEWIDRTVMIYAKTLLTTSDMSIQQISAHLNFPNPSFFGQYWLIGQN